MKTGWFKESYRHSLAARGVKTSMSSKRNSYAFFLENIEKGAKKAELKYRSKYALPAEKQYNEREGLKFAELTPKQELLRQKYVIESQIAGERNQTAYLINNVGKIASRYTDLSDEEKINRVTADFLSDPNLSYLITDLATVVYDEEGNFKRVRPVGSGKDVAAKSFVRSVLSGNEDRDPDTGDITTLVSAKQANDIMREDANRIIEAKKEFEKLRDNDLMEANKAREQSVRAEIDITRLQKEEADRVRISEKAATTAVREQANREAIEEARKTRFAREKAAQEQNEWRYRVYRRKGEMEEQSQNPNPENISASRDLGPDADSDSKSNGGNV
jgi:hypothetical protein